MEVKKYEEELLNILESNIENKAHYVKSLISLYPDAEVDILEGFDTWNELNTLEVEAPSAAMDAEFYKNLSAFEKTNPNLKEAKVRELSPKPQKVFTLRRLAIAMTFFLGLALGDFLDVFNPSNNPAKTQTIDESSMVRFASLTETPLASDRIKGIISNKNEASLNSKILGALNDVLINDPNINVRLSAIETLVLFWDIPEAREILIKAIPLQESPTVQLELADVMMSMEASKSSDNWNKLLSSDQLEPEVKSQLENTLKEIL